MRKIVLAGALAVIAMTSLTACGAGRRFGAGAGPDEMAVARAAPLVVPPDFAMTPPKPGAARPQDIDSSTQALQAMFGGPAARSAAESGTLGQAGANRAATGIRSEAGDPGTTVVDKGAVTRDVIAAPAGDGEGARATTPQ
jgi:Protein of unknown function (DUF3035)